MISKKMTKGLLVFALVAVVLSGIILPTRAFATAAPDESEVSESAVLSSSEIAEVSEPQLASLSFAEPSVQAGANVPGETAQENFTVRFYDADGQLFTEQEVAANAMAQKPDSEPQAPEGQTFSGWYLDAADSLFDFENTAITQDTELYPAFAAVHTEENAATENETNKQTFSPFGAADASLEDAPEDVTEGTEETAEEFQIDFVVDGRIDKSVTVVNETLAPLYTPAAASNAPFLGWYVEGEDLPFSATRLVTSNLTLTAKFSENYLVTYKDVDGSELEVFEVDRSLGGDVYAPHTTKEASLVSGQTFSHWALEGSNSEFDYSAPLSGHICLVPVMENLNLAIFITTEMEIEHLVVREGESAQEPTTIPTRAGYTFAG